MLTKTQDFIDRLLVDLASKTVMAILGAGGALVIALFVAFTHGLSRWEQAGIIGCSALVLVAFLLTIFLLYVTTTRMKRRESLPQESAQALIPEPHGSEAEVPKKKETEERLTIRIRNGFVARKNDEWTTMLLLLNVKVDGPPAEVIEWRLYLKFEKGARAFSPVFIDPKQTNIEYCPLGDRSVHDAPLIPKEVPNEGWLLFATTQAADEFFDHVFGGTFVLNVVENDGETSTVRQPPEYWLHRADAISLSERVR